jgi:hypothetical protein
MQFQIDTEGEEQSPVSHRGPEHNNIQLKHSYVGATLSTGLYTETSSLILEGKTGLWYHHVYVLIALKLWNQQTDFHKTWHEHAAKSPLHTRTF